VLYGKPPTLMDAANYIQEERSSITMDKITNCLVKAHIIDSLAEYDSQASRNGWSPCCRTGRGANCSIIQSKKLKQITIGDFFV